MPPDTGAVESYTRLPTDFGEVMVRRNSTRRLALVDAIIFDMDGVLIDVSDSIRAAHTVAAEAFFSSLGWSRSGGLVLPGDIDAFKRSGGFNNDWELAWTWQLLYLYKSMRHSLTDGHLLRNSPPSMDDIASRAADRGGGYRAAVEAVADLCTPEESVCLDDSRDTDRLRRLFTEVYGGDRCRELYGYDAETWTGRGLIERDRLILDTALLPASMKFGIATGRTAGEARAGIAMFGLDAWFPADAIVTEDSGFVKPDPRVIEAAVRSLGASRPLYVGDTPDDLLTAGNYGALGRDVLSCMILEGSAGPAARDHFVLQRADMIAGNVNAALAALKRYREA